MKILLQCLINKKTLPNVHLISIIREMHNTEANCDCIDHRIWGKDFKIKEDMHFFLLALLASKPQKQFKVKLQFQDFCNCVSYTF